MEDLAFFVNELVAVRTTSLPALHFPKKVTPAVSIVRNVPYLSPSSICDCNDG